MIASAIRHGKKRRKHEKRMAEIRTNPLVFFHTTVTYDHFRSLYSPFPESGPFDQNRKSGDNA